MKVYGKNCEFFQKLNFQNLALIVLQLQLYL